MEETSPTTQMLLGCDEDEVIHDVDFGRFGVDGATEGMCGALVPVNAAAGVDVKDALSDVCVGARTCEVSLSPEGLGVTDPAPGQSKTLTTQWRCRRLTPKPTPAVSPRGDASRLKLTKKMPRAPLRTRGADIVDVSGERVKFEAVNWAGGENWRRVPGGLDLAPARSIARSIAAMGFNAVRLPFSVDTVLRDPPVADAAVAANPFLFGATALEVMDAVIVELGKVGLSVILDNHMTVADWCCQRADCDGLWYHSTPGGDVNSTGTERAWLAALTKISARYAGAANVVAVELKNEPREVCPGAPWHVGSRVCDPSVFIDAGAIAQSSSTASDHFGSRLAAAEAMLDGYDSKTCAFPQWNTGPPELMYKPAMERGAAAVANANAAVLVVVDALYYGRDLTRAGDANGTVEVPETRESRGNSIGFNQGKYRRRSLLRGGPSNSGARGGGRLVYAVHDYSWYVTPDESTGYDAWAASRTAAWGYLVSNGTVPVIVNEFGVNHASLETGEEAGGESEWWRWFARYVSPGGLRSDGLDLAYWQLGGTQVGGTSRRLGAEESYGLLNRCWTGPASSAHLRAVRALSEVSPERTRSDTASE